MGKREAQFVTLRQLREEVGNDACRLFYLMRSHDQPLDFDLELAKSRTNENPVYYIQYAHARVASVMKQLARPRPAFDRAEGLAGASLARPAPHEQAVLGVAGALPGGAASRRRVNRAPARAGALPARAGQRLPHLLQRRALHRRRAAAAQRAPGAGARRAAGDAQRPRRCSASRRRRACERAHARMAKLTSRDYKKARAAAARAAAGAARVRLWPAGRRAVLAGVAFAYLGDGAPQGRRSRPTRRTRSRTARPPPIPTAGRRSARRPKKYDFYQMLPNFEVVVPEKDKDVKRDLPGGEDRAPRRLRAAGRLLPQRGRRRARARDSSPCRACDAKVQRVAVDCRRLAPRAHRPDQQSRRAQQGAQAAAGRRCRCAGD